MLPFSLSFGFVAVMSKVVIFAGAKMVMYVLFYRFLNKPETKAVFAEPDLNN
jgi:hypothetical protein